MNTCHFCIPWPVLPIVLNYLSRWKNHHPFASTLISSTLAEDSLAALLSCWPDCYLSILPVSGHCAKLSRGRPLRFPIATFRPIPTPPWARSVHARASQWALTWASHPRPTPRSFWVCTTSGLHPFKTCFFVASHLIVMTKKSLRFFPNYRFMCILSALQVPGRALIISYLIQKHQRDQRWSRVWRPRPRWGV